MSQPDDALLHTNKMPWIPMYEGIDFKLLRISEETGTWTVLFRCAKGSSFAPHFHHGPGEYLMIKGVMDYRAGVAKAGDYGYEPLGVYHEHTHFLEDTELLFTNHGPIAFVDEEGNVTGMLDYAAVREFAEADAKKSA